MGAEPGLTWLYSALIGASTAILAGVPLEHYRRHRDRQGTAAVISSEIAAMLHIVANQDSVAKMKTLLPILDTGKDVSLPAMWTAKPEFSRIFEKYLGKVGLLPVDVADRCVEFHMYVVGIRGLIKNLVEASWKDAPEAKIAAVKAAWIRAGEKLWAEAEAVAQPLIIDLRKIATEPWIVALGRSIYSGIQSSCRVIGRRK